MFTGKGPVFWTFPRPDLDSDTLPRHGIRA